MKFVTFTYDYSDEVNAYGFAIMTTEQWNEYTDRVKRADHVSYNDYVVQETPEDFLSCMEVTDINKEEYDTLTRIFGLKKYSWIDYVYWGVFPSQLTLVPADEIVVDEW